MYRFYDYRFLKYDDLIYGYMTRYAFLFHCNSKFSIIIKSVG